MITKKWIGQLSDRSNFHIQANLHFYDEIGTHAFYLAALQSNARDQNSKCLGLLNFGLLQICNLIKSLTS